jgi:hypothetical protein
MEVRNLCADLLSATAMEEVSAMFKAEWRASDQTTGSQFGRMRQSLHDAYRVMATGRPTYP